MLVHLVRDRDRNASCTEASMDSRSARHNEGEGWLKVVLLALLKCLNIHWKNFTYCLNLKNQYNFKKSNGV